MNCKPGDLAVVIEDRDSPLNVGRLCEVVSAGEDYGDGLHYWFCRAAGSPMVVQSYTFDNRIIPGALSLAQAADLADRDLRPIRDSGDDAADESHAWLPPVPTLEHA